MTVVDGTFSETQLALRRGMADFLEKESAISNGASGRSNETYEVESWLRAATVGLPGLLVAERWGGIGQGWVEAAIAADELGRVVWPSPYLGTALTAGLLDHFADTKMKEQWLPQMCNGKAIGSIAIIEGEPAWDPRGVTTTATVSQRGWVLSGTKMFVIDGCAADLLVVLSRTGPEQQSLTAFCVPARHDGVQRTALGTLDLARQQARIDLKEVALDDSSRIGEIGAGWDLAKWLLPRAAVCVAAESVGTATRALEIGVRYAKTRRQFDRPIGFFQGVSHKLAEAYRLVEYASSLVYRAAFALDASDSDASRLASMAKVYAASASRSVVGVAMQVHGGVGFTWDNPLHYYWRRAISHASIFGSAEWHLEQLAMQGDFLSNDE